MLACSDCILTLTLCFLLFWKILQISFALVFVYDTFTRAIPVALVYGKKKIVIHRTVNKLYLAGLYTTIDPMNECNIT